MKFELVYKETFKILFRFFYYKNVPKHIIEDLMQDTYNVFDQKYYNTSIDIESAKKLLLAISRNLYKQWVQKEIKKAEVGFFDDYDYDISLEELEDNGFQDKAEKLKDIVKEQLDLLNPQVRNVITLRFFENKTRKETAEILNITEDNVYTYQKRGIKYLTKMINDR